MVKKLTSIVQHNITMPQNISPTLNFYGCVNMDFKRALRENIKLIFSKKGLEIAFKSNMDGYNKKLKKEILSTIYFIPLIFITTYVWFEVMRGLNFLPFFLAFCTIPVMVTIYFYYYGKLTKRYGNGKSEQMVIILTLTFAPLFLLGSIAMGITTNNIPFGIGLGVSTIYPLLFMFKRIKTFSDKNVPKYDGPKMSIPLGPGYIPIGYWLLSALLGFQTTGRGFSALYFYFIKGNPSLEFCLVSILVGLVVQSIILFPDKLNKIVPIDLRTRNGFGFMFVLTIVLFLVSCFVMGLFNPEFRLVLW
jgi:hypothetical protein